MSYPGTYVIGLAFAFGWTPCGGPVLAAIRFAAASQESASQGAWLLFVYGFGMTAPFIAAALFIGPFMRCMTKFRHKPLHPPQQPQRQTVQMRRRLRTHRRIAQRIRPPRHPERPDRLQADPLRPKLRRQSLVHGHTCRTKPMIPRIRGFRRRIDPTEIARRSALRHHALVNNRNLQPLQRRIKAMRAANNAAPTTIASNFIPFRRVRGYAAQAAGSRTVAQFSAPLDLPVTGTFIYTATRPRKDQSRCP